MNVQYIFFFSLDGAKYEYREGLLGRMKYASCRNYPGTVLIQDEENVYALPTYLADFFSLNTVLNYYCTLPRTDTVSSKLRAFLTGQSYKIVHSRGRFLFHYRLLQRTVGDFKNIPIIIGRQGTSYEKLFLESARMSSSTIPETDPVGRI